MNKKLKAFILIGLPGSGKSYFTRKYKNDKNTVIISSDEIRLNNYGNIFNLTTNKKVFNKVHKYTRKAVKNNKNIIIDSTNLLERYRLDLIKNIDLDKYFLTAIYFETPIEQCIQNIDRREEWYKENNINKFIKVEHNVVYNMQERIDFPTKSEGFDEIIEYWGKF